MRRAQSRLHNETFTFHVVPSGLPAAHVAFSCALAPAPGRQAYSTQATGGMGLQNYTLDRGSYVEVAGARNYKLEIKRALGDKAKDQFNDEVECQLIPEVDNPYDPNAIAVKLKNLTIGYVPAEVAAGLSPIVKRLVASKYIPVTSCRLYWQPPNDAYDSDGWVNAGVVLPEPHLFLPINDPPLNSTLLPHGRSAQVIGEEDHFDLLFEYVPPAGEANLYLELKLGTKVLKNGTQRSMVCVFLDGEQVGELSAATGKKFEPTLQHLADMEKRAAVLGTIKGSALSASLTFRAAKSDEVEDAWVRSLPPAPGPFASEALSYQIPPTYQPPLSERKPNRTPRHSAESVRPRADAKNSGGCALILVSMIGVTSAAGAAISHFV